MEAPPQEFDIITLTPLDHIVLKNGGQTANTERLPVHLQASKTDRPPHFQDLHHEIGRLRQELAWHQEVHQALMGLFCDTREVYRMIHKALLKASAHYKDQTALQLAKDTQGAGFLLRESLQRVSRRLSESDSHLLEALGIALDDTSERDITVL